MATAVVSGRVDAEVKREVDRILLRKGTTSGEIIRGVWSHIYQTGELPVTEEQEEAFRRKRQNFKEFMEFVDSLPPAPDWFATMTDKEMNDMIAEAQMEKWGYV